MAPRVGGRSSGRSLWRQSSRCIGFAIGTPLGAAAALARGRFERAVERACDLVQAFPTFILALAVFSAVRAPSRVYIGCGVCADGVGAVRASGARADARSSRRRVRRGSRGPRARARGRHRAARRAEPARGGRGAARVDGGRRRRERGRASRSWVSARATACRSAAFSIRAWPRCCGRRMCWSSVPRRSSPRAQRCSPPAARCDSASNRRSVETTTTTPRKPWLHLS